MYTPDQSLGDKQASLSQGAARAIAKQTHKVHTDAANHLVIGRATGFNGATISVVNGIVTTKITASTGPATSLVGPTWGRGEIKIFFYQDGEDSITAQLDKAGSDGHGTWPVLNPYPAEVDVGKIVKCNLGPGGLELLTYVC